jgi:hypothetical protein
MADFSALCPLFSTGVYNELFWGPISLASRSTTNKFACLPPFGRSVIVTAAYVAKNTTFAATATAVKLALARAATWAATRTVFGTVILSSTVATQARNKPLAFTIASAKTFSATQVLHLKSLKKEAGANTVNIWIRYKEK